LEVLHRNLRDPDRLLGTMTTMSRHLSLLTGLTVVALAGAPAVASAAGAPTVSTGGATGLTPTSGALNALVNPQGAATTYSFQVGQTKRYGLATPTVSAGSGVKAVKVRAAAVGLAPATTYHYRVVAHNAHGTTRGADRTFTTRKVPFGLVVGATPNPVPLGHGAVLSGTLSGTGNAGEAVILQQNPFPYTQGFLNVGNPLVTDANGAFSFPVLSVPLTTQYRVVLASKTEVVSPVVIVGVAVRVSTYTSRTRVQRGHKVNFHGSVKPTGPGSTVSIQKQTSTGSWVRVARTFTRHGGRTFSNYSKSVTVRRGGNYRVHVSVATGSYTSADGRTVRIHSFR
jgi:hypothetical protein